MTSNVEPKRYLLPAVVVGVAAASFAYFAGGIVPRELGEPFFSNFWFQGDLPRVLDNLTDPSSDQYRASVHPAFAILLAPLGIAATRLAGMPAWETARAITALGAGLLGAMFFLVARRLTGRAADAALATAALMASSSFLFWTVAPETYVWGSVSVVGVFLALARSQGAPNQGAFVLASAASLGFTVTNWAVALIAAALAYPWRRAFALSVFAFAAIAALAAISVNVFPSSQAFLHVREEGNFIHRSVESWIRVPPAFFSTAVIMPKLALTPLYGNAPDFVENVLSVQAPHWRSQDTVFYIAALCWLSTLGFGAYRLITTLVSSRGRDRFALTLALAVAAQFTLHLLYGDETFLYALHFAPLLILVALFAAVGRWRMIGLALLAATTLFGAANNWARLDAAVRDARAITTDNQRSMVRTAQTQRPHDLWPRSNGHVPIGLPGLDEDAKAYVEPGGAFSPAVGSFGVDFWVRDRSGRVLSAASSIPLSLTHSRFLTDGAIGVEAGTPYYVASWRSPHGGEWRLQLRSEPMSPNVAVVIRSVGPAGGPITSLRRRGKSLVIDGRWTVALGQGFEVERIGVEGDGLLSAPPTASAADARDAKGWCYAIVRLVAGVHQADIEITSSASPRAIDSTVGALPLTSGLKLDLPDSRFAESLDAQVTQILMGVVGDELRPGDPVNYPLDWQRDAAHSIVALVRAGRTDAACVLIRHLAETDYFGGFGAETDAPGLALWAIAETARALNDPVFDEAMAPHVERKAREILAFMNTSTDIRRAYAGPLAPAVADRDAHVVATPSRDGLIHGRMDWHDPTLYLTGVSAYGLEQGAAFAARRGDGANAALWRKAAARLRRAWRTNFDNADKSNARTLSIGLSPTGLAAGLPQFHTELSKEWGATRDRNGGFKTLPLWTYFDLANARQWLALGDPDRAWATLDFFWNASPHPGLYTLWESNREENGFGRWSHVRGWIRAQNVTPHYWASAEMILLQTEMLARVDSSQGADTLIIGAGVPKEWIGRSFGASGLATEWGPVNWRWDGVRMHVVAPSRMTVRLGPAFPQDARVEFELRHLRAARG